VINFIFASSQSSKSDFGAVYSHFS